MQPLFLVPGVLCRRPVLPPSRREMPCGRSCAPCLVIYVLVLGGPFSRFWGLFLPGEVSLVLEKLTNCVSQNAGALGR